MMNTYFNKLKAMVNDSATVMQKDLDALTCKIRDVERQAVPDYVVNRNTGRWHRILASYANAGSEAIAFCGYKFGKAGAATRFEKDMPEDLSWKDICGTCLPEVRAARAH